MKSRYVYTTWVSGLLIVFFLAACAQATSQPTSTPQPTYTPAATITPIASVTRTPSKSVTPVPPPTRRATPTIASDLTATKTPIPSFTLKPGSKFTKTITATITGTNTLYVRPKGFGFLSTPFTLTPQPFKCSIISTDPDDGTILKPRTDFIAKWKILNSGVNMWHKDDILMGYVSGTKMHNPDRVATIFTDTLYVGTTLNVQIHMRPPKEPGVYTETWGFRKTNKKDFFCMFSVTVEVVRK